jgi:Fe-Mn family superoxide dismutase
MPFQLPALPYAFDALEPHIDARTMEIHHGKHHVAYINNLNTALEAHPNLLNKDIDDLMGSQSVRGAVLSAVRSNGGGHANHSMFWTLMGTGQGGRPRDIGKAIDKAFQSFEALKENFARPPSTAAGPGS